MCVVFFLAALLSKDRAAASHLLREHVLLFFPFGTTVSVSQQAANDLPGHDPIALSHLRLRHARLPLHPPQPQQAAQLQQEGFERRAPTRPRSSEWKNRGSFSVLTLSSSPSGLFLHPHTLSLRCLLESAR